MRNGYQTALAFERIIIVFLLQDHKNLNNVSLFIFFLIKIPFLLTLFVSSYIYVGINNNNIFFNNNKPLLLS